jgi:hypothetical protein
MAMRNVKAISQNPTPCRRERSPPPPSLALPPPGEGSDGDDDESNGPDSDDPDSDGDETDDDASEGDEGDASDIEGGDDNDMGFLRSRMRGMAALPLRLLTTASAHQCIWPPVLPVTTVPRIKHRV